jgi:uncharacterized membrane protein YozB (DUF420 family)
MGAEIGTAGEPRIVRIAVARGPAGDRWFFGAMAVVSLLVVVVGFARSYYLGRFFGAPRLTSLVHLHGLVSTSWMLLFLTQTSLVAARRTDLHRRLGLAGLVVAVLVVVVGYLTAIEAARLGRMPPGAPSSLGFLAIPLGTVVSFGVLAGLALVKRRRSESHKRLMLLATIAMLPPAFARMGRLVEMEGPPFAIGGTCLLVLTCLAWDRMAHGRVHPAFLWGGLLLMLSLPLRFAMGGTEAWLSIARWLTS